MRQVHDIDGRRGPWSDERKAAAAARAKRNWQDPDMRARMVSGHCKASKAEVSQRISAGLLEAQTERDKARAAVRMAGLPLLRRHVDDAQAMMADGQSLETVVTALRKQVAA